MAPVGNRVGPLGLLLPSPDSRGPYWVDGGRKLVYLASDFKLTAVDITADPSFQPGEPRGLFQYPAPAPYFALDGRMLVAVHVSPIVPAPFTVVLNWPSGLKKSGQ